MATKRQNYRHLPHTWEIGRMRYDLYRRSHRRLNKALRHGFWLEAIAIEEAIIADRLESLLYALGTTDSMATLNQSRNKLWKHHRDLLPHDINEKLTKWWSGRNFALHMIVKYGNDIEYSWTYRLQKARECARSGDLLVSEVSKFVSRELRKIKRNNV